MCESVQKRQSEIYTLDSRKELITVTGPLQTPLFVAINIYNMTMKDLSQ